MCAVGITPATNALCAVGQRTLVAITCKLVWKNALGSDWYLSPCTYPYHAALQFGTEHTGIVYDCLATRKKRLL